MAKKRSTATKAAPKAAPKKAPRKKPVAKKDITVALSAPEALSVRVAGSFCNWEIDAHPLKRDRKGNWKGKLSLKPGRYEYRFFVDGVWCDDPSCGERVYNEFGSENCVLTVK